MNYDRIAFFKNHPKRPFDSRRQGQLQAQKPLSRHKQSGKRKPPNKIEINL